MKMLIAYFENDVKLMTDKSYNFRKYNPQNPILFMYSDNNVKGFKNEYDGRKVITKIYEKFKEV